MSLVAGGARGGSHRVEGSKEESLLIAKSLSEMESSRRRSLRKREEKSYVESPDLIFEEETSSSSSTNKGKNVISNGDVEMESDDDDEPLEPLPLPKELPPDAVRERKALIRKLQTQLRNEEMSLVLLKKIRQSQVIAEQMTAASLKTPASATPSAASNSRDGSYSQHRATPPPGKAAVSHKSQGSRHQGSPAPAQIKNLVPDLSQLKPVNVDPSSLPPGLPASLINMINKSAKLNNDSSAKPAPKVDTETPAQKQAAAKLALRKQLEKTLLQIPPPKPPPPEMHFIPNPANTEFICLLGLEECVGKILHEDKENSVQPVPFTCSQCGTDFTPTWKWDKGARGKEVKVICEACVTSNVKKALKAEHTNRLKAAFVKALQQEQELEAHMAAQAAQSTRGASPDTSSSRSARAGTIGLPSSLDVTVRSTPATVRPIPSAHQSSRTTSSTPSVTIERAHHRSNATQSSSASASLTSNSRTSAASITPRQVSNSSGNNSSNNSSAANLSRMSSLLSGNATPPLNNSVSVTPTNASRSGGSNTNSSKNDASAAAAMAAVARDSANAMAAAALMGAYDPATMALLQQQLLLSAYGSSGGSSSGGGSNSNSSGRGGGGSSGSSGSSSNNSAAAALTSQLAAMSQHLMNPLLYNYQALAMAQAMQAAGLSGMSSGSGSSSGNRSSSGAASSGKGSSSSSSSQSATNQMLEIQRQVAAAEQLQRQYLLDMIPPGHSWGKK